MGIPGDNLLSEALELIESQTVTYYVETGRAANAAGDYLTTYAAGVPILSGSVQTVDRSRYQQSGLDWQKNYVNWFVPSVDVENIARNKSGDVFEWPVNDDGSLIVGKTRRWQLIGETPWKIQDDWAMTTGIDIGPGTGNTTNA